MNKLILPAAAAFALSLGAAAAQTETQTTKHYDAGTFVAPAGYTYTRYSIGERVPHVLIATPNLVLGDYSTYRLDSPPEGLVWIRVGNDALLVSRSTGEVIQTDYDLFD